MLTWSFFFYFQIIYWAPGYINAKSFHSAVKLISILIYTVYIYVFFHWLCCIAERPDKDTPWE